MYLPPGNELFYVTGPWFMLTMGLKGALSMCLRRKMLWRALQIYRVGSDWGSVNQGFEICVVGVPWLCTSFAKTPITIISDWLQTTVDEWCPSSIFGFTPCSVIKIDGLASHSPQSCGIQIITKKSWIMIILNQHSSTGHVSQSFASVSRNLQLMTVGQRILYI